MTAVMRPAAASGPGWGRLIATVLVVAVGLAWCAWTAAAVGRLHDSLDQRNWVLDHASARSYPVAELGLQQRSGRADAVWIAVRGDREAFVDLHHSAQVVTRPGQTVRARLDGRRGFAGTAVAEDLLHRPVLRAGLDALAWPGLALGLLVGIGVVVRIVLRPGAGSGVATGQR